MAQLQALLGTLEGFAAMRKDFVLRFDHFALECPPQEFESAREEIESLGSSLAKASSTSKAY